MCTLGRPNPRLGVSLTPARKSFVLVVRYPGSISPSPRALGAYGVMTLEAAWTKGREWLALIAVLRPCTSRRRSWPSVRIATVNQHSSRCDVLPHTIATVEGGNWSDVLHRLGVEGRDRGAYRTLPTLVVAGRKGLGASRATTCFRYLFLTCWRRSQWCAPLQNGERLRIIG